MRKLFRPLQTLTTLALIAVGSAQAPLSELLPDTTLLAVHVSPEGFDATTVSELVGDLDLEPSLDVLKRAFSVIGGELAEEDMFGDLREESPFGELTESCPELSATIHAAVHDLGPSVAAVSFSRFDPEPALVFATRPEDPALAGELVASAVECLDGRSLGSQGESEMWVVGDGGDFPLVLAATGGTFAASSDPDALRAVLRRAEGTGDPGFTDTRIGRLTAGLTSRGVGFSVNLAAVADALEAFRFVASDEEATGALFDRLLATLRVVNGFAWHATVDAGGVLVESVASYDERLAAELGEDELIELLTCAGCRLGAPQLLPRDAVAVSGGVLPVDALVAWLDSWLSSLAELGAVPQGWDVRSAVGDVLGLDLDAALLGWLGDSWHAATLGVLDTDLRGWLQGPPTVVTVPVSSEDSARAGVAMWPTVLARLGDLTEGMSAGTDMEGAFRLDEAVSVREGVYRGVAYTRYRTGPSVDVGVAVFGGHLVIGSPVAALHEAIDVFHGDVVAAGPAWRTYEGLGLGEAEAQAYGVTYAPDLLRGIARVSDLAAGSFASVLWFGLQGAAVSMGSEADLKALPSYDELIGVADAVTAALRTLADRTGPAVGTAELVNGARWSTWRLPLR